MSNDENGPNDVWVYLTIIVVLGACLLLFGCGGGPDEAPGVAEEAPKYHVPVTPDPCTTTYPCQPK